MSNAGTPVRQIDIVRMDFTPQDEKRRKASQQSRQKKLDSLQQALSQKQAELKLGKLAIGKLKSENNTLKEAQVELQTKLAQQMKEALNRERELVDQLESNRQELAAIKRKNASLQEVLLEMEQQQTELSHGELKILRKALALAEERRVDAEKRRIEAEQQRAEAEKRAKQSDLLSREKQVQEIAIEMLSEDIEELNGEKAQLIEECNRLKREFSEMEK